MAEPTFSNLNLADPLLRAVQAKGYETPTPIQQQAIPHLIDGRDLLGVAQTGTGKTAAFALPILHRLSLKPKRPPRRAALCLVLTPTRELAAQIADNFEAYGKHLAMRHALIFGGVGQAKQVRAMRDGVEVLVATPGRLLDLMSQGHVDLGHVETFVLDEADRMLDMGFIHDVRKIIAALPPRRHTLLFSATMPPDIVKLSRTILEDPVRVEVTPQSSTVELIEQGVMFVEKKQKRDLLGVIVTDPSIHRALVFTRTKHGANRVAEHLKKLGVTAAAIHGNKSQSARERALEGFRRGTTPVLIATDIAARGIDVPGISHVINFDLPNIPETYVHRIGRTARAGRDGVALSFCDVDERAYLRDIERLTKCAIRVIDDHPHRSTIAFTREAERANASPPKQNARGSGGRRDGRRPAGPSRRSSRR